MDPSIGARGVVMRGPVYAPTRPIRSGPGPLIRRRKDVLSRFTGARFSSSPHLRSPAARHRRLWAAGPDQGGRCADPDRELQPWRALRASVRV